MKRQKKHRSYGIGKCFALAAFLGAVMCVSFFSVKVLIIAVAALLIVLGIFLLRL